MENKTIEVVMLGHKAGVGKDTLANMMAQRDQYFPVAFADKLKESVQSLYLLSDEQLWGNLKNVVEPRYGLTPRQILQQFGQKNREIYAPIWANYVFLATIERAIFSGGRKFVVTDFRFPNEFEVALKWAEMRGDVDLFVLKIDRQKLFSFEGQDDISETALDDFYDWDATIKNDGTPEELYTRFKLLRPQVSSE